MFYETVQNLNSLAVSSQAQPSSPSANLAVSENPVTLCSPVTLALRQILNDGGRGLSAVSWSLTAPSSAAALGSYLQGQGSVNSVSISQSYLTKNVLYAVQVQYTNFIGASGQSSISFQSTGCLSFTATFSDDLQTLLVSSLLSDYTLLSATLNANGYNASALCAAVFDSATRLKFGSSVSCL